MFWKKNNNELPQKLKDIQKQILIIRWDVSFWEDKKKQLQEEVKQLEQDIKKAKNIYEELIDNTKFIIGETQDKIKN